MNTDDVRQIRKEFPMLDQTMHGKPLIYLDTAATAHKPRCVIDAMTQFYSEQYATVHRSVYDFAAHATSRYNRVRERVKEFIHAAHVEEIIFTRGTTEGINLVAQSYGKLVLQPGDEVLISVMEHHSNIVPWQRICAETGAQLKAIPINARAELDLDAFDALLTPRTKIVSIAHIANATGTVNPVEEIVRRAHQKGAKVFIDGAQAITQLPIDVQKIGADFYAFSGHKAYGPTGIGILYGKLALLEIMPPYECGGDMISEVTIAATTYQKPPLKFEAGTPSIAEVIGLGEAIQFLSTLGMEKIAAWEHQLLLYATEQLEKIPGLRIIGTASRKGAIISFTVDGMHPLDIGTLLDIRGIAIRTGHLCAQPTLSHFGVSALARVSFGLYNTLEEITLFVDALREVLTNLAFKQGTI